MRKMSGNPLILYSQLFLFLLFAVGSSSLCESFFLSNSCFCQSLSSRNVAAAAFGNRSRFFHLIVAAFFFIVVIFIICLFFRFPRGFRFSFCYFFLMGSDDFLYGLACLLCFFIRIESLFPGKGLLFRSLSLCLSGSKKNIPPNMITIIIMYTFVF